MAYMAPCLNTRQLLSALSPTHGNTCTWSLVQSELIRTSQPPSPAGRNTLLLRRTTKDETKARIEARNQGNRTRRGQSAERGSPSSSQERGKSVGGFGRGASSSRERRKSNAAASASASAPSTASTSGSTTSKPKPKGQSSADAASRAALMEEGMRSDTDGGDSPRASTYTEDDFPESIPLTPFELEERRYVLRKSLKFYVLPTPAPDTPRCDVHRVHEEQRMRLT